MLGFLEPRAWARRAAAACPGCTLQQRDCPSVVLYFPTNAPRLAFVGDFRGLTFLRPAIDSLPGRRLLLSASLTTFAIGSSRSRIATEQLSDNSTALNSRALG